MEKITLPLILVLLTGAVKGSGPHCSIFLEWPQWRDGESFKWSAHCDFYGYDMYYRQGPAEACGKMCEDEVKCTHFTWRTAHNGTCWLKRGNNLAASSLDKYSVCGYMQRGAGDTGSNQVSEHVCDGNKNNDASVGTNNVVYWICKGIALKAVGCTFSDNKIYANLCIVS